MYALPERVMDNPSMYIEHGPEIIALLVAIIGIIGVAFFALIRFFFQQVIHRLKSIEDLLRLETREIREELAQIKVDHFHLEGRVAKMETKCTIYHGENRRQFDVLAARRRAEDKQDEGQ